MGDGNFHDKLKIKMDSYVYLVYRLTKQFPRDELYGIVSQLRRAALSVILNYIEGFQGELLLVHGMADDNVHVQNSMQFIEKMQKEGHQFRLMVYPGKNHGISGGKTTYHLFRMISEFILENL